MRSRLVGSWLAFIVAVAGASPAQAWLDAGELGAAGFELGVMHPPGMPGLAAVLHLAALVPVGGIGFRLALVSAMCAALTVGFTMALLARRQVHPWIQWGAAAWLVAGMTFVRHVRGVEIYGPQLAALAVVLWCLDPVVPTAERLPLRLWGTWVGAWAIWCFAELRLLLPPIFLWMWVAALRRRQAYGRWAPLAVVGASVCVAMLPLASARGPMADWGNPQGWTTLVDHLLARSIRTAYADQMLPRSAALWWSNLEATLVRLSEDLGPVGPVAVALALLFAWLGPERVPHRRAVWAMTWFVFGSLVYAVGINPMGGADRQTGLVLAYVGVVVVAVVLDRLLHRAVRLRLAILPLLGCVFIVPAALESWTDPLRLRSWAPHAWTRAALAEVPPNGLLLTQSDDLSAGVLWARVVEGARPDVTTWPGQHLHRGPPDRVEPGQQAWWHGVAAARGEQAQVDAAIRGWSGPVALENAGSGVFAGVRDGGAVNHLPVTRLGAQADLPLDIDAEIDRWNAELVCPADRSRLAMAIGEWARAWVRRGGDVQVAILALQLSLTRVDPRHGSAMVTLGSLYDRLGDGTRAIEWTRRGLAVEPDRPTALLNLALYLSRDPAGRDEALALAERAVALRPWRADGWSRLAQVRQTMGDLAGAGAALRRARELATSP